ncbi:MAG: elongation factor P [Erythrobacter sp.]|jgi:hypothetical protein
MNRLKLLIPFALGAGLATAPLGAQGHIGLLEQGDYVCALPGDAAGAAWIEQEGTAFSVTGGSSYRTARGAGTYLLEGKQVTFTRGPMKGMLLLRLGSGLLQQVDKDGKLGRLRCHRTGPLSE